jgi:hypothetical protein
MKNPKVGDKVVFILPSDPDWSEVPSEYHDNDEIRKAYGGPGTVLTVAEISGISTLRLAETVDTTSCWWCADRFRKVGEVEDLYFAADTNGRFLCNVPMPKNELLKAIEEEAYLFEVQTIYKATPVSFKTETKTVVKF